MIWAILRGLLWALADEFPLGGRKTRAEKERPWWEEQAAPKDARTPPGPATPDNAAPAEKKASAPTWWAAPAPPSTPPTIKVETEEGTFISRATFSGSHVLGVRPVRREREEGESRRRRRTPTRPVEASPVTNSSLEPLAREPAVPTCDDAVATRDDVESGTREAASPSENLPLARVTTPPKSEGATPIDSSDVPRVAKARRVRGRLADPPGAALLATTLATRLALTRSASPALSAAKNGESA